jgi:hypothetical protein
MNKQELEKMFDDTFKKQFDLAYSLTERQSLMRGTKKFIFETVITEVLVELVSQLEFTPTVSYAEKIGNLKTPVEGFGYGQMWALTSIAKKAKELYNIDL